MPELSIEECRQILGLHQLTDEQIEEIRGTLYGFAHTIIDEYLRDKRDTRLIGQTQPGDEPPR